MRSFATNLLAASFSIRSASIPAKASNFSPADACRIDDAFCPVGKQAGKKKPMFEILDGFTHENHVKYERFLAANQNDVEGIELIVDADGKAWTYDVNTNTN